MAKRGTRTIKAPKTGEAFARLWDLEEEVNYLITTSDHFDRPVYIRVMACSGKVAGDKLDAFTSCSVRVVDYRLYVRYEGEYYEIEGVPPHSCDLRPSSSYPAIYLTRPVSPGS